MSDLEGEKQTKIKLNANAGYRNASLSLLLIEDLTAESVHSVPCSALWAPVPPPW